MRKAVDVTVYAEDQARRLGGTGWVRNEPDGSVGGHFEGEAEAVDALVDWCRTGPRLARVEHVRVRETEVSGARSFDVRF